MPATATANPRLPLGRAFAPLREQLVAAAEAFADPERLREGIGTTTSGGHGGLADVLAGIVADVDRLVAEPLEIFPVAHHSPAAALHLIRRLKQSPPRVIFVELCEDLRPVLPKLRDCKLPVALQAFAQTSEAFPKDWTPLSVVAPITEFSAEFQAIAYCLENPGTDLVFVDRSVDHVFQWTPREPGALEKELAADDAPGPEAEDEDGAAPPSHGGAVGVQIGRIEPTFGRFREFLLKNARVKHFAEWWHEYVEQPLHGADYATFRQVMTLVGSLLRRLGREDKDLDTDRLREKYMWTRMKDYLRDHQIDPADALHICGACHAASDVPEFGTANDLRWAIPDRTPTAWLYGVLPSSYQAIDHQFGFPAGTVTLSDASWDRGHKALGVKPFDLRDSKAAAKSPGKPAAPAKPAPTPAVPASSEPADLMAFLTRTPELAFADDEQLLGWCVGIVALARKNGYLTSTADTIAVYHTAVMLAQLRNRSRPTPYDFRDAAVTCLEKDRPPRKRDVNRLCDILLGGDRVGRVGFDALPPLAQNVLDRLAPLKVNLTATTIQRALMNIKADPALLPCSDLLWKLHYLLGPVAVRPIMGERKLGHVPVQESWDLAIGKYQGPLIQLAYEGVTVEQVLEKRLHKAGFGPDATAVKTLTAAEDALLFLKSDRLVEELGYQAEALLTQETGGQSAPEVFERLRRLVHFYRSTPAGLPEWVKSVVATGYGHYTTLLPTAFEDAGTSPPQLAGMLAFLFTLEGLALSLGCSRSQFEIAVKQAGPRTTDQTKLGLLWTTEWLLGRRTADEIRRTFDEFLENPLAATAIPAQLQGYLLALRFTPLVTRLVAELVGKAFERLPDRVLMPWLPGLILMLRDGGEGALPALFKEVSANLPARLAGLSEWQPPWHATPAAPPPATATAKPAAGGTPLGLLAEHPATLFAVGQLLGIERTPIAAGAGNAPSADGGTVALLRDHPGTLNAVASLL